MTQILTNDDLFALAQTVWSSVLGLELTAKSVEAGVEGPALTSCVQITGEWEGAVTVSCSANLALNIAAAMFAMEPAELSDEEVRDALGEIANVTGGNVKGIAPGENQLALPTVTEGGQGTIHIAKSQELNRVLGSCDGEVVEISVFGKDQEG